MNFLIDNALPPRLAVLLQEHGHDAVHVRTYEMQRDTDYLILLKAREEQRIVVSADTDFGTLLALYEFSQPSCVLFREPALVRAEDYLHRLLTVLSELTPALTRGCVAVFRNGRIRIRNLPFIASSQ